MWQETGIVLYALLRGIAKRPLALLDRDNLRFVQAILRRRGLALVHRPDLLSTTQQALIEGWAGFFQAIFPITPGLVLPRYSVTGSGGLRDLAFRKRSLGEPPRRANAPPLNRGERVEGAFANGLETVFADHVVGAGAASDVSGAPAGVVTTTAPWILDPAVQDRFRPMIWLPMRDLKVNAAREQTSSRMIEAMRHRNPVIWHRLVPELMAFNMAMAPPAITGINPVRGPRAGGQTVTITGNEFIAFTQVTQQATPPVTVALETEVRIGGRRAANVRV